VVRELPDLVPGPGTVVVDVEAAGVNYPDVLIVAGRYQLPVPVPFTPGSEYAGRVSAVGAGVTRWSVGDAVMGASRSGAFAEQVEAADDALSPVPVGLDMVSAAAFHVTYATAFHALVTVGAVAPDEWVVVLGASGGVGSAAVDIAHRLGARVLAGASSQSRLELAATLGADEGVSYLDDDLKRRIRQVTGDGADLVIDPVGGPHAEQALRGLRWGGRFVSVGFASGEIPRIPLNLLLLKNVTVRGMDIGSISTRVPGARDDEQAVLSRLVAEGMRPLVTDVFDLESSPEALRRIADRRARGKLVVQMV
jgi:NADPH2:quinone reductase